MTVEQRNTIDATFRTILKDSAFIFAEPVELPAEQLSKLDPKTRLLLIDLGFEGQRISGKFEMVLPMTLAITIAANMLGVEPDDPQILGNPSDSAAELLNMAASHILSALYGNQLAFQVKVPGIRTLTFDDLKSWSAQSEILSYDAEGAPLFLRYRIQ